MTKTTILYLSQKANSYCSLQRKKILRQNFLKTYEPKKNIDKISDVIVSIRYIQQQIFKTKPKQAELLGNAVDILEKAQSSL